MIKDDFYEMAQDLLDCEKDILKSSESLNDLLKEKKKLERMIELTSPAVQKKNRITAIVSLGSALLAGILLALFGDGAYLTLLFGVILICGLSACDLFVHIYRQNKHEEKSTTEELNKINEQIKPIEQKKHSDTLQRDELIKNLNQMRQANRELEGRYWWDAGIIPDPELNLPGDDSLLTDEPDLSFDLGYDVTIHEKDGRLYCEDIYSYGEVYPPEIVQTLEQSNDLSVIYRSDEIIRQEKKGYILLRLYALIHTDLYEIEESTQTISHVAEKQQQMQEYKEKLDSYERLNNAFFNNEGYYTNQEAALYGKRSYNEYLNQSSFRSMLENQQQSSIDQQDDYEDKTVYRQVNNNLFRNQFITCAYVLMPIDMGPEDQVAMVLYTLTDQPSIQVTLRSDTQDNPYSGYLEEYCGEEALQTSMYSRQSLKMVIPALFNDEYKELLKIKPRNILEPKPKGLSDEEWVYLLWNT